MAGARGLMNPDFNLPCLQNNFQGTSQVRSADKFSEFKMSSTDVEMSESQENNMKQNETEGSAEMSSTAGDVGEVKENDDKHSDMVDSAKMSSTAEEVREIKEDDNYQSDMVGCAQMSSTDGDMGEITENDIDDTKKYIMSFPPKTKFVWIDDACLRRIDFEECLFPDDGWLDGDCINAYIYCLRMKEHLATRAGGKVCSSCGLFLLKFMEEWTGQELAHPVTQDGLKLFRKQLPYRMLNTNLNILKGRPELPQPDQKGEASDVLMWEGNGPPPTELSQGNQTLVADSSIDPKQRLLFDDKREIMARICDHWPGMVYHVSECNSVAYALRIKAVVHMLSYRDNECADNIAQIVRDLVNMAGVADTSNGGEPTDRKERNRQRRQNYAQMDPQKKDELLKKRRESYQQKKAKLQSTQSVTGTQQSALTQLESTPAVKGATATNTENVAPVENEAYQLQSPHMSSQWQESLVTETVDINNSCTDGPTSLSIHATPICPKERRRQQDRERYAHMDSTKKENLLKRHRESLQKRKSSAVNKENEVPSVNNKNEVPSVNKKNEVPSVNKENEVPYKDDEWLRRNDNYQRQSIPMPFQGPEIIPTDVIATYCTQESHGGPSALCQLESTPAVKGDTARDKENLVPDDNDALHMQLPHTSSQGQGSLVTAKTVNKETEVPLAHKENEVHSQDDEWLRRNDNYQMHSIPMLFQGQEIIPTDIVDMENCNSNEPTSSRIQPQPVVDSTEKKKRERERYAQMNIDSKNELLAKRHATYQQKRLLAEHIEKRRAKDRLLYAAMSPKKKHSKKARQELRRNSLNEESIAMENPCWIPEVVHTPDTQGYIPTCDWHIPDFSGTPIYIEPIPEQMSVEPIPEQKSRRKHVTPGERHALLGLRNEAFYANSKKHAISSADENPSMSMEGVNGSETPTQSAVVNNETTPPTPEIVQQLQTQSPANDDREDEGVILEEDSEDEEGYMFAGQEDDADEDVEIDEVNDDSASVPNIPDPYDMVYNKIPTETHMLKPVDDCKHKHCGAKKFEHEPPGFCCRNGQIKLANTDTPPELMRIWTSEDPDARHFRDNIRFFNGHFSFTSLYCNLDGDTTNTSKHPIYTFRAHGKMYHNIRSFGRIDGLQGSHLELYFFDDDPNLEHRYRSCRKEQCAKDKEVITQIVNILKGNPYSEHLRSMGEVEDIDDYRITLNLDQRMDQRTYNAPTTSEVAAVWVEGSERRRQFDHSVILQGKNRDIFGIKSYHGCYDALSYPLFFPRGELGWHTDIPKRTVSYDTVMAARAARLARRNNNESSQSPDNNNDDGDEDNDPASGGNKCVSVRDYYCYKFQMRPGIFNPILHGKRLFQQFAVDTYIKIENSRLDYMWNHQDKIRADLYQGLMDSLHAGEGSVDAIGKRTVLSGTFIGGPRDKRRRYMDAMALVRKYGKPDIFLTMTCNPNWDEIKREVLDNSNSPGCSRF
ncbi:hypothetical protein ACQ4PT_039966 [Festuca glaucescens]